MIRANIPELMKAHRSIKKYCPWRDKKHMPIVIRRRSRRKKHAGQAGSLFKKGS